MQIFENTNGKMITVRPSTNSKRNVVRSDREFRRAAKAALAFKLNKIVRREMEEELTEFLYTKQQTQYEINYLYVQETRVLPVLRAQLERNYNQNLDSNTKRLDFIVPDFDLLDFTPLDSTLAMSMRAGAEFNEKISQEQEMGSRDLSCKSIDSVQKKEVVKSSWWLKQSLSFLRSFLAGDQPARAMQ